MIIMMDIYIYIYIYIEREREREREREIHIWRLRGNAAEISGPGGSQLGRSIAIIREFTKGG